MVKLSTVGRGLVSRRSVVCRARTCAAPGRGGRGRGGAQVPALQCLLLLALAILAVSLTGCRGTATRLTIRGGPSLDALFSDLARAYQQQNPRANVICDFTCPPCVLYKRPGAIKDFDLFASLGQFELEKLKQAGAIDFATATSIGTTTLALVTSTRARGQIGSLADLHKTSLRRIGVGDPEAVGVGYYAKHALSKAGLWKELQSHFVYSQSGCELLKWLGLGRDIDAAIVFSVCSGDDRGSIRKVIEFPPELIPPVPLLLATPSQGTRSAEARRFVEFAQSEAARPILLKYKVRPVCRAEAGAQPCLRPRQLTAGGVQAPAPQSDGGGTSFRLRYAPQLQQLAARGRAAGEQGLG